MIHPIRIVIRTTAMNPPISGQYMARNDIGLRPPRGGDRIHLARIRLAHAPRAVPRGKRHGRGRGASGVEGDLFVGRRERPCHLEPALLAEHEAKLARRPQPVGVSRPEGRAGAAHGDRAQMVLVEEAILAARFG